MKLKKLVAAIALTVAAGSANAAIDTGLNGEVFFSIWDADGMTSYTVDLTGPTAYDYRDGLAGYQAFDLSADANYSAFVNKAAGSLGTPLVWNVVAVNSNTGLMTTALNGVAGATASGLSASGQNVSQWVNAVNNGDIVNYNLDLSKVSVPGEGSYFADQYFGDKLGSLQPFSNIANVGDSMAFYDLAIVVSGRNVSVATTTLDSWSLSSNGMLTYGTAAAPVPVPAAAWLFGSAMIGMVGVARRRKNQA